MAATLNVMGEREDTMRRALKGQQRELVVHDADGADATPVVGRVAGKGLADELNDRGYLVVDGIDARAHYLKLPARSDLSELPTHAIVEAKPPVIWPSSGWQEIVIRRPPSKRTPTGSKP